MESRRAAAVPPRPIREDPKHLRLAVVGQSPPRRGAGRNGIRDLKNGVADFESRIPGNGLYEASPSALDAFRRSAVFTQKIAP
mgnify:CR=1 FL=1